MIGFDFFLICHSRVLTPKYIICLASLHTVHSVALSCEEVLHEDYLLGSVDGKMLAFGDNTYFLVSILILYWLQFKCLHSGQVACRGLFCPM